MELQRRKEKDIQVIRRDQDTRTVEELEAAYPDSILIMVTHEDRKATEQIDIEDL